jgi:hypothetical protein
MLRSSALLLALASLAGLGRAQSVGSQLPPLQLEGLAQSKATTVQDLKGRALLIEFFAFW